ncbi:MAG: zf-HC2 domain-containing protein [Acidobacteriota bacterium]
MEFDLDKEMDILLRSGRSARPGPEPRGQHVDADSISAFAERALPDGASRAVMAHLSDCDDCRKILAGVILGNSGVEESVTETAAAVAPTTIPWYRRLFLFPNLAYVMGSLVLLLGGFMAFQVVRNMGRGSSSVQVSQANVSNLGPAEPGTLRPMSANTANTAANAFSSAANSMSAPNGTNPAESRSGPMAGNAANSNRALAETARESSLKKDLDAKSGSLDGVDSPAAQPPPPPAPAPKEKPSDEKGAALASRSRADAKPATGEEREKKNADTVITQAPAYSRGTAKAAGPSRDQQRQFPNVYNENDESGGKRRVGSRDFEFKQGVWYDVRFRGQPTINVRRGSDEYEKLDSGLRSLGDSFTQTVVIVWGSKAYRIQ